MRAVNLLPSDGRRHQRRLSQESLPALVGAGTGVLVVAVLAGGYLSQSSKVSDAQQQLDAAKTQLASTPLPPPPPKVAPAPVTPSVVTNEQEPRLQALSAALSQRIAWDRILREFSLVLPSDVWLTSLTMTAPTSSAGSTTSAGSLALSGTTYSYDSVARLLSRLSLIPDLTGVALSGTTSGGKLVQFNVGAAVKGGPAPAAAAAPAAPTTDTTSTDTTSGSGA